MAAAVCGGGGQSDDVARPAVVDILSAGDHYAALRAQRDATAEELRRCYLRASVQVHPDKNTHPDATKAFQRVAASWAVLGNPDARRTYDARLLAAAYRGRPDDSDDDLMGGFEGPEVTPEQAFAAFAFAMASGFAMGAGGGGAVVSDVAEAMFWAEQLGSFGQSSPLQQAFCQQPRPAPQADDPLLVSCAAYAPELAMLSQGAVLSVGLFAAGVAASCVGLPKIGKGVRRMALMQGATQLVMASQIPPIRVRLVDMASSASQGATQLLGDVRQAGRAVHEDFRAGTLRARIAAGLSEMDITQGRSCLPSWGRSEGASSGDAWPPGPCVGSWVRLCGMQKAVELDGRIGELLAFHSGSGRYQVRLFPRCCGGDRSGEEEVARKVLVKGANLCPAVEAALPPPKEAPDFI